MPLKDVARHLIPITLCAAVVTEGVFAGAFFPSEKSVDSRSSLELLADQYSISPELVNAINNTEPSATTANSPLASFQRQVAREKELSPHGKAMMTQLGNGNATRFNMACVEERTRPLHGRRVSSQEKPQAQKTAPLRWDSASRSVALASESNTPWEKQLAAYMNRIPLENHHARNALRRRAVQYSRAVDTWSRHFKLKPDLVYALIHTESNFNPRLVSGKSAHGLMQVVPNTAGEEVKRWLGESGLPSTAELFDPYTNIKYGTGYFRLLLQRYLSFVKDPVSREYCAIAAYNSGCMPVLRLFGQNREQISRTINKLSSDEVLNHLLDRLPFNQTRTYLRKVLKARQYFASIADSSAEHRATDVSASHVE